MLPLLFVVLTVARAPAQFGAIVGSPGAVQALWTVAVAGIVIDRVIVARRGLDRLAVGISALLLLRAGLSFVALTVGRPGAISFASAALSGMLTVMASAAMPSCDSPAGLAQARTDDTALPRRDCQKEEAGPRIKSGGKSHKSRMSTALPRTRRRLTKPKSLWPRRSH